MAAGGYIYEQVDLGYNSSTNGATVRSWALAVHLARCEAFVKAYDREYNNFGGNNWYSVQTSLYDEFSEWVYNTTVYVQDIHPTSVDTSGEYPAFVSFFRNYGTGTEYCIITYSGFNADDSYSDPTTYYSYGLYIPKANLGWTNGGSYVSCGGSMAHAFASHGFNNYDVCSQTFLTNGCTNIMAAHMIITGYPASYQSSVYSIVGARANDISSGNLVSKTYQFGFAIKGTQIIALERRSDADGWLWSIIGDIFDTVLDQNDTYKTGCIVNDYYAQSQYETSSEHSTVRNDNGDLSGSISFCNTLGVPYKPTDSSIYLTMTRNVSYYAFSPCARTDKTIPSDTRYNAVGVGAVLTYYNSSTGDLGVDGNSNGGKGFLSTDMIRQVSAGVCQSCGATFQLGNFVAMKSSYSYTGVGFILGWDPSNISIM